MANNEYAQQLIRRAYVYSLDVISFIDQLNKTDFVVQIIAKQFLRSATSIGANIIEAQAASSRKDFVNFLNYSLKSANESEFWLGLLRDSKKASQGSVAKLMQETVELAKILGSSVATIRGKNKF